ncbi:MAG: DUF481 domain-containing protein [Novosphingobium sp.]|nr:DUF481 domain-containing protein [Novosphingobium sp.]
MPARLLVAALTMAVPALSAEAAAAAAATSSAAQASATLEAAGSIQAYLPPSVALIIDTALGSNDPAQVDAVVRTVKSALQQAVAAIEQRVASWPTRQSTTVLAAADLPTLPARAQAPSPAQPQAQSALARTALPKITGEGEAGAFRNTGNAPGIGLVGGFKMLVEGRDWRIGTNVRADYQETSGVVTREQYRFSAEPNYKFDERGYLFGLGQYEEDRFQGFDARYSLSGGLGYKVLNGDVAKINVKAGPAWRVTEPVKAVRESVIAGLASLEAKVVLAPGLQYSQDASIYSDATGSTFYTLAALDSKLIGKLKARLSYMVQHETAPELGRLGTDTTSRLTLVYGF